MNGGRDRERGEGGMEGVREVLRVSEGMIIVAIIRQTTVSHHRE